MKKGAADFLLKPFDENQLVEALNKAVEEDRRAKSKRNETGEVLRLIKRLSPRELEIFRYVIAGMLNKQIAYKLGITERTVKAHRSRITEKLGVSFVVDLLRMAETAGIKPADK
jgi:two-component system, LuxR family, response regulator FixJ